MRSSCENKSFKKHIRKNALDVLSRYLGSNQTRGCVKSGRSGALRPGKLGLSCKALGKSFIFHKFPVRNSGESSGDVSKLRVFPNASSTSSLSSNQSSGV